MYRIIRKDKYGLYIKFAGHIYRPQFLNKNYSYEDIFETMRRGNRTFFNHKDKVKIGYILASSYINVKEDLEPKINKNPHLSISKESINEIWYSDGLSNKGKISRLYRRINNGY